MTLHPTPPRPLSNTTDTKMTGGTAAAAAAAAKATKQERDAQRCGEDNSTLRLEKESPGFQRRSWGKQEENKDLRVSSEPSLSGCWKVCL